MLLMELLSLELLLLDHLLLVNKLHRLVTWASFFQDYRPRSREHIWI
jgi:hypothetical protein